MEPPFILFAMEKTATSSMQLALLSYFDDEPLRRQLRRRRLGRRTLASELPNVSRRELRRRAWNTSPRLKHLSPAWFMAHADQLVPTRDYADFTTCCFVRNPFDRLAAVYSYHTQKINNPQIASKAKAFGSFEAWLAGGGTGSADKSMRRFVCGDTDAPLVDYVGRYERLAEDWAHMLDLVGLEYVELPYAPATRSDHPPFEAMYDERSVEIVLDNQIWKADIEYFGYEPPVR